MGSTNGTAMVVQQDVPSAKPLATTDATRAFEPRDISEAERLCGILVASGLLPKSIQRPEAAFAIVAAGRELGLTAMQSLRSIHIIEGKPSLSADLAIALCKSRADVCKYFMLVESSDQIATYETLRAGDPKPTKMSFTWADAQRAGVTGKDNWKKYPPAMLRARAGMALARAVYPELLMGIYDPDEIAPEPGPAQPGNFQVIAQDLPKSPPSTGDLTLFADLCDKVDAAETHGALNSVANKTTAAHKAGRLTKAQYDAIADACKKKRPLVDMQKPKAAPEPPPSEPRAEDDGPSHEREPGEEG